MCCSALGYCLGLKFNEEMGKNEADSAKYISEKDTLGGNVKSLTSMCLRRFFYVRCYNSLQFLATLKVGSLVCYYKEFLFLPLDILFSYINILRFSFSSLDLPSHM